jgi:hypothetical protein
MWVPARQDKIIRWAPAVPVEEIGALATERNTAEVKHMCVDILGEEGRGGCGVHKDDEV